MVIDGKFEQRTEDAVIEFQRDHHLEPNGKPTGGPSATRCRRRGST
ncbi:peptidoglycan-binding protein [Rhizobium tibeticum]